MNAETLLKIKLECEKIEKEPGFGKVLVSIENGCVHSIQPTQIIRFDNLKKK